MGYRVSSQTYKDAISSACHYQFNQLSNSEMAPQYKAPLAAIQVPASNINLPKTTKGLVAYTTDDPSNSGTFTLGLTNKENVAVTIFYPYLSAFTSTDNTATFSYNNWESVGKTQVAEVSLNKTNLQLTMTFWYGDLITGVYSTGLPSTVQPDESFARVSTCTFKIKV